MRRILYLLFLNLGMFSFLLSHAQQRSITGKVMASDDNSPLVGVTITHKSSGQVVVTNNNGQFSIPAKTGDILQFSFVGMQTKEIRVTDQSTIDVRLLKADNIMTEIVVSMDVKRNPKELGFSAQKVQGSEIAETQRENFVNGLQGRVAGLTINSTSGTAGASSSIVLRGFNSMALDNQPLFVIDGIIMDNSSFNETSNSNSGLGLVENSSRGSSQTSNRQNDYTNRASDINPNDIESITVLKGPEATALYGSQASSGAIIISTKKGKATGKVNVNYDNAFRVQKLTRFPRIQNVYSNGDNGSPSTVFRYFGPKYAEGTRIYDNIDEFFRTGFSQTHNLSADFGRGNSTIRVSGSVFDQKGVVPQNDFRRYNFRITSNSKIGKFLEITPSITMTNSENNKPLRGQSGYLLNLLIWPNQYDIRDWQDNSGGKKLILAANPNAEIDNPYFSVNRNRSKDVTNRVLSTLGVNVTPLSWLSFSGRFGYDTYSSNGFTFYHPLSYYLSKGTGGSQDNYYKDYTGYNHTLTATAKKTLGDFSARIMIGNMWQDYRTEIYSTYGTNIVDSVNSQGLMVKNNVVITEAQLKQMMGDSSATRFTSRQRLNNATRKGIPNYSVSRQLAYFGEVSIGYKNYAFLTYTQRFETSSIFPKAFRNYNYPAGSFSLIMSDMLPGIKKGNIVNYWKLRSSLASTARSSSPYRNQSVFNNVTSSGGGYAYGFDNNNYYLEPEIQKTYEVGTEMTLIRNRFNLDVTYYNTLCKKQIAEGFRASYGTGFVLNTINVGTTRNEGVEISVSTYPIKKANFDWNIRFNFNKMWNKVVSLPANVPEFYISDTWIYLNARGGLVTGGPTTAITTFQYLRNINGDLVIDPANGLPTNDPVGFKVHGDRNPDFTLGTINTFHYKNWSLNFLWDLKVGGDIFNATEQYLTLNGKSLRTLDREIPRVIKGVLKDGKENSANPTPNNIVVTPYFSSAYYSSTNMPDEVFVEHDINWLRLRDLSLSYNLSSKLLKKLPKFKSLSFFATGNDLILITNYTGADPAVSGNSAATRGVGGWGFDFGNIGSPISVNFGLRAGF